MDPLALGRAAFQWLRHGEVRSGGFVLSTERAALWCLANTSSYAECVLVAANLGDDTLYTLEVNPAAA